MDDRGYHTIWDITGASAQLLRNDNALHPFFLATLRGAGFTVISDMVHKFSAGGEGVTGLFLLSESHLSYHTYPESGYISIDVYTCGKHNGSINDGIAAFFGDDVEINRRTLLRGSALSTMRGVEYAACQ